MLLLCGLALAYDPVAGINFPSKSIIEETNFYHGITFKFQLNRQSNTGYYDQLIYRAIYESSVASFNEIEKFGLIERQCNPNEFLEIFEVSESQLNDPKRFPADFVGDLSAGRGSLLGFYDPRNSENYRDAIVITPHDNAESYRIIVHEIAHYWHARFCLQDHITTSSEDFALKIQSKVTWQGNWSNYDN